MPRISESLPGFFEARQTAAIIDGIVAEVSLPITRYLSPGLTADDPEGRRPMEAAPTALAKTKTLLMDKAY